MMLRNLVRLGLLVIGLAACASLATPASAAAPANAAWRVTARVPVGLNPDDLHVLFAGTGGTIKNEVLVAPAGAIGVSGGNQIDVTLAAKANPGDNVVFTFTTQFSPVRANSGYWTNGPDTIGVVNPDSVEVECTNAVPGASDAVLIALAALMLGTGAFALRRRRMA